LDCGKNKVQYLVKSVLFCRFICVKVKKKGGGVKIVSLLFMKACGGVEVHFLSLLTLALDEGVWKTAHTASLLPGREHSLYSWNRGWVGPEPVWAFWRKGKSVVSIGNRTTFLC
jgi:hypothetical protein